MVHEAFEKCRNVHINSDEVYMKLYKPGLNEDEFRNHLENIMLPVYKSVQNAGFRGWNLKSV